MDKEINLNSAGPVIADLPVEDGGSRHPELVDSGQELSRAKAGVTAVDQPPLVGHVDAGGEGRGADQLVDLWTSVKG